MDSYRVSTKRQFVRARTRFLYLGGGASPHRQDNNPQQKHQTEKPQNHQRIPLDPLRSIQNLLWEFLPARLLVVRAASDADPVVGAHGARDPQRHVRQAAGGDDMLLEQPNDEDELHRSAEGVRKKSEGQGKYNLPGHACRRGGGPPHSWASLSCPCAATQRPDDSSHGKNLLPGSARR